MCCTSFHTLPLQVSTVSTQLYHLCVLPAVHLSSFEPNRNTRYVDSTPCVSFWRNWTLNVHICFSLGEIVLNESNALTGDAAEMTKRTYNVSFMSLYMLPFADWLCWLYLNQVRTHTHSNGTHLTCHLHFTIFLIYFTDQYMLALTLCFQFTHFQNQILHSCRGEYDVLKDNEGEQDHCWVNRRERTFGRRSGWV